MSFGAAAGWLNIRHQEAFRVNLVPNELLRNLARKRQSVKFVLILKTGIPARKDDALILREKRSREAIFPARLRIQWRHLDVSHLASAGEHHVLQYGFGGGRGLVNLKEAGFGEPLRRVHEADCHLTLVTRLLLAKSVGSTTITSSRRRLLANDLSVSVPPAES